LPCTKLALGFTGLLGLSAYDSLVTWNSIPHLSSSKLEAQRPWRMRRILSPLEVI
jgi:hypothetical protein